MPFRYVTLLVLLLFLSAVPAHAEKRVALVIGNAAYKNATALKNPRNDAADVSEALKRLGFETIVGLDLDKSGMEEKEIDFARAARDADVALVYYSGHAMQFGGSNYLMPVDAALRDQADLRRLTRVDDIVVDLKQAKNLRILVLDACRVNPLAEELSRSMELTRGPPVDGGIARMIAPKGMIISFATQPNQTAADGQGRNSPYTMAFLKNIEAPEEIGTVFHHMTADVYNQTLGKQLPELSLSYIGDFYLKDKPKSDVAASSPTQVAVVAPPSSPPASPCDGAAVAASLSSRAPCPLSAAEEGALKPKEVFKECEKCPEMIVVPAGSFTMGSPSNEPEREKDEDQVRVTITKPFAVGRFAVTFDEWDQCVADGGCVSKRGRDDGLRGQECEIGGVCATILGRDDNGWGRGRRPVINVSWDNVQIYVAWLSRKTGKTYRLLSDAEREYVTRAGTTTPFWWGKTITPQQANYVGTYSPYKGGGSKGEYRRQTVPVDSFEPNPWGLYNVHGNVYELTQDCWNTSNSGNPGDGSARTLGDCASRVLRGGAWIDHPGRLRAAYRTAYGDYQLSFTVGFRVARTLSP
jgi:formylglycine-generating enzyme required for sulfatase activity